jgi:hypothetical protein
MKVETSKNEIVHLLIKDNDCLSYYGAEALVEYLEQEDPDQTINIGDIKISYTEYESCLEAAKEIIGPNWNTELDISVDDSDEEMEQKAEDWLRDQTLVIKFDKGVVIQEDF